MYCRETTEINQGKWKCQAWFRYDGINGNQIRLSVVQLNEWRLWCI